MAKPKAFDVDAMLSSIPESRSIGTLERWLDADNDRATRFFELFEIGRAAGKSYEKLVSAWNAHTEGADRCPVKQNQVRVAMLARGKVTR